MVCKEGARGEDREMPFAIPGGESWVVGARACSAVYDFASSSIMAVILLSSTDFRCEHGVCVLSKYFNGRRRS